MGLRNRIAPGLDGAAVPIGDGTPRRRSLIIPAGEYPTPLWLRDGSGRVERVASLPWRGVREVGSLEVLSSDPAGGGGGDGEPQFTGAAGQTLVLQDDFESTTVYNNTTQMGETDPGVPCLTPTPSPEITGSWGDQSDFEIRNDGRSGRCLRINRDGLNEGEGGVPSSWITRNVSPASGIVTHNVTYYARLGHPGGSNSLCDIKWFWFTHPFNRCEFHTHTPYPQSSYYPTLADETHWGTFDAQSRYNCMQPLPPNFNDIVALGFVWVRYTYSYRAHSGDGSARDGWARMWINGVKVIDVSQSAVGAVPAGGYDPAVSYCAQSDVDDQQNENGGNADVIGFHLLSVQTSSPGSSGPWTFDLDDVTYWTEAA